MESRITELEIKLSHCEDNIDALNHTVFRQQQQMELLQAQIRELYRMTQSESSTDNPDHRDDVPPHY